LNQKQQKAFLAFVNQLMRLGFLRIHQLSKKSDFFAKGVFFLLTSPLMGDTFFLYWKFHIFLRLFSVFSDRGHQPWLYAEVDYTYAFLGRVSGYFS